MIEDMSTEARNRTLSDWMTRIRTCQVMLPRFQRLEAWESKEITDLLEVVLRVCRWEREVLWRRLLGASEEICRQEASGGLL